MNNLYGSYYVLTMLPIWATALIMYMLTIGVLFILRDIFEGLFYNTSYSAMLGDGALVVVGLMTAGILQRGGVSLPTWAQGILFHQFSFFAAGLLGFVWSLLDQPKQWGDRYHHAVIAPLLCYLGLTLLPVIFWNGTRIEITATVLLILLWAGLVVYDAVTRRLNQRQYRNVGFCLNLIKSTPIHPR